MTLENGNNLLITKRKKQILVTFGIFAVSLLMIPPMYTLDVPNAYAAKSINDCEEFNPDGVDFTLEEATIADIHDAILAGEITSLQLVCLYFDRIKAYSDEQCVTYPEGFLGPTFTTSLNAGSVNGYNTLNLRPDARENLGFDERKDRTQTDPNDNNPKMPDALEVAAALDKQFAKTGELVGPLHGIPIAIKDQVDTFDMRTTTGDDALYDDVRPPDDAFIVAKLREAGAIIIGKALSGDYAGGFRSSWGGVTCNPYDTTRNPSSSSAGSGVIPSANLAVCAIAEDTGGSIRGPASVNGVPGLRPTMGLISTDGLFFASITRDSLGAICRTVLDVAVVTDVIKGFDPEDPRTAASIGRIPSQPFSSFATETSLDGFRIGVVDIVMIPRSDRDVEVLRVVNEAIDDLESLGAEIISVSMRDAFAEHIPNLYPTFLPDAFPELFPVEQDSLDILLAMDIDPSLVPIDEIFFPERRMIVPRLPRDDGERKFGMNFYLEQRGDKTIKTVADIIDNHNSFRPDRVIGFEEQTTLDNSEKNARRIAIGQIMLIIMSENNLDAIVHPARDLPVELISPRIRGPDAERTVALTGLSPLTGFPELIVPAGFSEITFDWKLDEDDEFILTGPFDSVMPISIALFGQPFDEATLFEIGAAYEAFTNHRAPPPDFGPLENEP